MRDGFNAGHTNGKGDIEVIPIWVFYSTTNIKNKLETRACDSLILSKFKNFVFYTIELYT